METRANFVLIGAFTLLGFLGLLGFVLWFTRLELDRQFAYYDVYFPEVSGLGRASEVRFAGLPVGRVVDMQLAPGNPLPVRVRLEVALDTPVRADSSAALEVQGVTGVALVAITPGSTRAPLLSETGREGVPVIPSSRSALQTLTDEGPNIINRLSLIAEQMSEILGPENQARITAILDNAERSTGNLDAALADVAAATEAIGDAAAAISTFGGRMDELTPQIGTVLDSLARTVEDAGGVMTRIDGFVADDLTRLAGEVETGAARIGALAERSQDSLDALDRALATGDETLAAAGRIIREDLAPVSSALRDTLSGIDRALAGLPDDLPRISASLREAAESAASAFASLRLTADGARVPIQSFARETLPQISRLSQDARSLVENMNQLVTTLRRNPSQLLSGPRTPEFRR